MTRNRPEEQHAAPSHRAARVAGAALLVALGAQLAGCAVATKVLQGGERERLAAEAQRRLFEGQEPIRGPLTLAEATARAIKYQAEHRQRRMEEVAAAAQLEVAQFDLLPRITANAGYTTRDNDAFGFGFTPAGTVAANPSSSVERTRNTASIGIAWNVLDFGVSYFRARQLSDQKLIAEERRRKAVQQLMHDVRIAWWRAEAAERLLPEADRLLAEVEQAIEKTRLIEARKLLPPVQTATLRRALLDLDQQITLRRQDLAQARIDLAALVSVPPGAELRIATLQGEREVPDLTADLSRLEVLALSNRPEMAEEGYRARISADEARKALLGLLPGLTLDLTRSYDSNRFLLNNVWTSAGINVAFNLVKVFSLPALERSEKAQKAADDARRQALAMAVLAQTRLAAVRYALVADEYLVWDEAARDDELIVQYLASSEKAGIDNELELIRTRARAMASRINRDLAYANLQAGMARLFSSVGYDAVARADESKAVAALAGQIEARYGELERLSFAPRAAAKRVTVLLGTVSGTDTRIATLLREGVDRVLQAANLAASDGEPGARLDLELRVADVKDGRRTAQLAVNAVPPGGTAVRREFRTTLSEPVDDEQWRVVGEGAAYRVISDISPGRITRPLRGEEALRRTPAGSLPEPRAATPELPRAASPELDGEPLTLRLEAVLGSDLPWAR